jgi:hypothetical protein
MYLQEHLTAEERTWLSSEQDRIVGLSPDEVSKNIRNRQRWGMGLQLITGSVVGMALADVLTTSGSTPDPVRIAAGLLTALGTYVVFEEINSRNQDITYLLTEELIRRN